MERLIAPQLKKRLNTLREKMFSVTQIDIGNPSRKREYVVARAIIAEILHSEGYTFKDIGRAMGKNHASIIHYVRIAENFERVPGFSAERELLTCFRGIARKEQ